MKPCMFSMMFINNKNMRIIFERYTEKTCDEDIYKTLIRLCRDKTKPIFCYVYSSREQYKGLHVIHDDKVYRVMLDSVYEKLEDQQVTISRSQIEQQIETLQNQIDFLKSIKQSWQLSTN